MQVPQTPLQTNLTRVYSHLFDLTREEQLPQQIMGGVAERNHKLRLHLKKKGGGGGGGEGFL